MANEMMRIFFPLKIITYPQGEYGVEDNPMEITSAEAVSYEDAILAAIAKENRLFENDRGLAEYIHNEALKQKVHSLYPSVEVHDGELWGVMTAGLTESLSGEETAELLDYVVGQNADGYGEGFEQRPIKTPDGEIYVSFWDSAKTESACPCLIEGDRMGYFTSLYSSELPHRAVTVYMYLRDRCDKDGKCYPAIGTIAAELKLSRSTVKRAIADLIRSGRLHKEQRWRENGGKSSCMYYVS